MTVNKSSNSNKLKRNRSGCQRGQTPLIEIDWLKTTLQVSDAYPRIESFKRKVIDVATQQIKDHTDITTSYTQRKTGRNVTHLNFKIDAKESAPKVVKRPSLTRVYVEKHALPGESWEVARERLRAERGRAETKGV